MLQVMDFFQMFSPPVGGNLPRNGAPPNMENSSYAGGGGPEFNKGPGPGPGPQPGKILSFK